MMTLALGACTNKSGKITEPQKIAQTKLTKEAEDMMPLFNAMNSFFFEIKTIPN